MSMGREGRGKGRTRENGAHCETAHEKPVIEMTSVALPTLETNLPTKNAANQNATRQLNQLNVHKKANKTKRIVWRNTYKVATIHKAKRK